MIRRLLAIAAASLLLAAFGQATVGTPIVGIPIGLEGDPDPIVASGRTDARGEVVFSVGPGRYSVFLTDPSAAAVVTVTPVTDAPSLTSAPISPVRGRVYAVDSSGRRLTTVVPRGGGRVRVTLTEATSRTTAPPAPGGASRSETGYPRATVNSSGGVIAAEAAVPVNGIGGTGGGRLSNRGQSENGETPATVASSGGRIDILAWSWGRIDRLNTAEACTARRGVVLMHEGVQQCRLPATARREEAGSALGQVPTTR
ncbi:hypothetical protein BrevBR_01645 [Brevundimonas sp. BR2-1]|uniref:hypothetical protein n=1 Tax=Brevundimonas sp. BR2-1 TaxID=3031123 RepID=UPI0030B03998